VCYFACFSVFQRGRLSGRKGYVVDRRITGLEGFSELEAFVFHSMMLTFRTVIFLSISFKVFQLFLVITPSFRAAKHYNDGLYSLHTIRRNDMIKIKTATEKDISAIEDILTDAVT